VSRSSWAGVAAGAGDGDGDGDGDFLMVSWRGSAGGTGAGLFSRSVGASVGGASLLSVFRYSLGAAWVCSTSASVSALVRRSTRSAFFPAVDMLRFLSSARRSTTVRRLQFVAILFRLVVSQFEVGFGASRNSNEEVGREVNFQVKKFSVVTQRSERQNCRDVLVAIPPASCTSTPQ